MRWFNKVAVLEPVASRVDDLESAVAAKGNRLAELESLHAEKDHDIGHVHNRLAQLEPIAARVPELEAAHAAKDQHIAQLQTRVSELEPLASWVPELEAAINAKDIEIANHVEAHNLKNEQLGKLQTRVAELEPLAARVPELEAAAQASEIAGHIASDSEKDAQFASRLMQLKAVEPSPSRDAEIDALRSQLQEAEYEASVAAARLRITHDDDTAKEYEIADLRTRMRELSDQLEQAQSERASALAELQQLRSEPREAQKAMAAAAGFYDGGISQTAISPGVNLSPKEAESAHFQDRIQEYQSRIEELQQVEAHKDQEISMLRLRLADLQTLPEPLTRQQIQLSAKDAELEHMRGLLDSLFEPLNQSDIALRALGFAQARGFQNGSEQEDWLRAERQVYQDRLNSAREWSEQQGLF